MKPQFHFNCCTSTTYDERTWNKNEQNGILLHLLHVKYFMYIVQWSTKHHPSHSFFYYLYKKVLLCIAKCSIVEHSKVGFLFFMVSIEMVVDFLTRLYIEWRMQSTNVIQCLKSKHISFMTLVSPLLRAEMWIVYISNIVVELPSFRIVHTYISMYF